MRRLSLERGDFRFLYQFTVSKGTIQHVTPIVVDRKRSTRHTNSSTPSTFPSATLNFSFNSATSTFVSLKSSSWSSVFLNRALTSSTSFSSLLFSFSSSSIRPDCFLYTSCTASPSALSGGNDGDFNVADGDVAEALPCEIDDFRNDDERIFDWMESEGCRVCPARGASSFPLDASSDVVPGAGDGVDVVVLVVGSSGMGSVPSSSSPAASVGFSASAGCGGDLSPSSSAGGGCVAASASAPPPACSDCGCSDSGSGCDCACDVVSAVSASFADSDVPPFFPAFFFFWRAATYIIKRCLLAHSLFHCYIFEAQSKGRLGKEAHSTAECR